MHQPRSYRSARAMKLGALTLVLLCLSSIATVSLLGYAIYEGDRPLALGGLGLLAFSVVLFIAYRVFASNAHCPLCRGPVLSGSGAQRNRNAKRTFGSHRLRVARSIIFTNSFICPYCNEATRCVVKQRPPAAQVERRRSAYRR